MSHVVSILVAGVLGCWSLLIVLAQLPATRRWLQRAIGRDRLALLPGWWFFAGQVGDIDIHVLVRDRDGEGCVSPWSEPLPIERRHVLDVWTARRRTEKSLVDITNGLALWKLRRAGVRPLPRERVLSFLYLVILNHALLIKAQRDAVERQFALVRTGAVQSHARPEILLVSPFHRLG